MTKEVSALVNSPVIWGIALVTMSVVIFLAVNYLIKTIKVSKELGITGEDSSEDELPGFHWPLIGNYVRNDIPADCCRGSGGTHETFSGGKCIL